LAVVAGEVFADFEAMGVVVFLMGILGWAPGGRKVQRI
jgi:hypothetical protein